MIEPITDRDIPYGMERCSCCDGFAGHTVGHSYDDFELLKCDVCGGKGYVPPNDVGKECQ